MLKISVFGNRIINEVDKEKAVEAWELISNKLDLYSKEHVMLHGGAKGIQEEIINYISSTLYKNNIILFKPWTMIDKKIKFVPKMFEFRNRQILENSDLVVILTNGEKDSEVDKVFEYLDKHPKLQSITVKLSNFNNSNEHE